MKMSDRTLRREIAALRGAMEAHGFLDPQVLRRRAHRKLDRGIPFGELETYELAALASEGEPDPEKSFRKILKRDTPPGKLLDPGTREAVRLLFSQVYDIAPLSEEQQRAFVDALAEIVLSDCRKETAGRENLPPEAIAALQDYSEWTMGQPGLLP